MPTLMLPSNSAYGGTTNRVAQCVCGSSTSQRRWEIQSLNSTQGCTTNRVAQCVRVKIWLLNAYGGYWPGPAIDVWISPPTFDRGTPYLRRATRPDDLPFSFRRARGLATGWYFLHIRFLLSSEVHSSSSPVAVLGLQFLGKLHMRGAIGLTTKFLFWTFSIRCAIHRTDSECQSNIQYVCGFESLCLYACTWQPEVPFGLPTGLAERSTLWITYSSLTSHWSGRTVLTDDTAVYTMNHLLQQITVSWQQSRSTVPASI